MYEDTLLTKTFKESLGDLVEEGVLPVRLAQQLLSQFDRILFSTLDTKVPTTAQLTGTLDSYRYCDDVWTFVVADAVISVPGAEAEIPSKMIKITASADPSRRKRPRE
jgi:transcription initiation factor TFIIA small subunit